MARILMSQRYTYAKASGPLAGAGHLLTDSFASLRRTKVPIDTVATSRPGSFALRRAFGRPPVRLRSTNSEYLAHLSESSHGAPHISSTRWGERSCPEDLRDRAM
jgi:hypothetical protein